MVKTVSDYSELLLGSGYPSPTGKLYNVLYLLDDDYMLNESAMSDDEDYLSAKSAFPFFTWQSNMWQNQDVDKTYYDDCYTLTYERLVGVNAVLDGIDEAIGTTEEKEMVKAEALALRGYYYFMLVNIYGEPYNSNKSSLGVPLKLNANINTDGLKRSSVEEVYVRIIKDLTESSAIFEKYPKTRGSFRINLPTVNILLTRAYLQMNDWDGVIEAATKAIENGNPITNYINLPQKNVTFSKYSYSEVEWLYGNGYRPCSLPGIKASSNLMSKFSENDTRLALWFYNGNVYKKRLSTPRTPTNAIRISEAYLARAEAKAEKNDISSALADLNSLRINRYKSDASLSITSKEDLLEAIKLERRLELCFDEVRWFDLRRYGMPSITHLFKTKKSDTWQTYILEEKDPLYTLPISNSVIEANTQLEQNGSALEPLRQSK
jgi:SusD family.